MDELRTIIAMQAMNAFIVSDDRVNPCTPKVIAEAAFEQADAMLNQIDHDLPTNECVHGESLDGVCNACADRLLSGTQRIINT